MIKKYCLLFGIFIILLTPLSSQMIVEEVEKIQEVNLNNKYRYPFSFGAEYLSWSPLINFLGTDFIGDYSLTDVSFSGRLPIPSTPVLQPTLQLGMLSVSALDQDISQDVQFEYNQFYGLLGLDYMHKNTKEFEIGAGVSAGAGYVYYPTINDGNPSYSWDFIAALGARAALNVSYNIHLEFKPMVRYQKSLMGVDRFNGFAYGFGVSGSYRTGVDPDAPQAQVRSIRFEDATLPPLFAAMQSYYSEHPVGIVTLKNVESFSITDVNVSFFQGGYMDSASQAETISEIAPGETVEVPFYALFNGEVFLTEGITPLTGQIQVTYDSEGRAATQNVSISYDLHDKEAMTWDDDKKVASFITPADAALRNYVSFIRQSSRDAVRDGYSAQVQTAMQIFYALAEIGILYQLDPTSPFDAAQDNPQIVDAVSLPRNTLTRGTGDCDDLTVLFCALLESAGMESAFITVPGHIYVAFNTKVAARDYKLIHPEKRMTLPIDGELWVPVEITMIGNTEFSNAWRIGMEEWEAVTDDNLRQIYFTREAQETFRPVGLRERDLGLQYGDKTKIVADFSSDIDELVLSIIADYTATAQDKGNKGSFNKLGIVCAQFAEYTQAERAFNNALSLDRNYTAPKINLGNVFYMKGEYQNALRILHGVEDSMIEAGKDTSNSFATVLLNISRCYYEIENYDQSEDYSARLAEINPEMASRFAYLAGGNGSRASDVSAYSEIQFADEE